MRWEDGHGTSSSTPTSAESKFLDLFDNVGYIQHADRPTHSGGRILDLVLSNSSSLVRNLNVLPQHVGVKSDHYTIEFEIDVKAKRLKSKK